MPYFDRIAYTVLATLFGLCVGSFLNVVIYRLPAGIKMTVDRSHCPQCKALIHWYDNIPLLSYLILGGKCRHCKKRISPIYPIVEALNMIGWLGAFLLFWDNIIYACMVCVAFSCFICVCMIDWKTMLIYDRFNIILALIGVGSIFVYDGISWVSHLIGLGVGLAFTLGISLVFKVLTGKEGMGMGDVKLSCAVGLMLGWQNMILSFLIATVSATVFAVVSKKSKSREFPFAPFLTLGFAVSMYFGNSIIFAYLSLFNLK